MICIKDSSGRSIPLLHDDKDMKSTPTRTPHLPQPTRQDSGFPSYPQNSLPNTPLLERSDSCDSQPSGNEGPMTPPTAASSYPDLFSPHSSVFDYSTVSKESYNGDVQPPLPRLRDVVPAETFDPNSPHILHRRRSSGYSAHMSLPSEHKIQRSIEYSDDSGHDSGFSEPPSQSPSIHNADYAYQQSSRNHVDAPRQPSRKDGSSKPPKDASNPKRFPCKHPGCKESYTTSGHASRHAKIHNGEKNIPCSFEGCTKRFTRSDNMKQHLQTHRKNKVRNSSTSAAVARRRDAQAQRPTLARRRQSMTSSNGSLARLSTPGETPPIMSPRSYMASPSMSAASPFASPGFSYEGWTARPAAASRTSSLETLAMVATTQQRAQQHQQHHEQDHPPTLDMLRRMPQSPRKLGFEHHNPHQYYHHKQEHR